MNKNRRQSRSAFTLIEMLLGLSIASIIALSVYSVFFAGVQLNSRSKAQNQTLKEAQWSMQQISQDLSHAIAYDFRNSYPDRIAFNGKHDRLSFLKAEDGEIYIVSYYLEKPEQDRIHRILIGNQPEGKVIAADQQSLSEQMHYLVREKQGLIQHLSGSEKREKEIVSALTHSGGLKIYYAGKTPEAESDIEWVRQWQAQEMPSYVRLEINFLSELSERATTFTKFVYIPHGSSMEGA